MQKIYLVGLCIAISISTNAQNLFSFGKETVTRTEFIQNFFRNNNNLQGDRTTSLKENLELYIRYKLKVKAAYDAKLDTLQNQQDDLKGFRQQIEGKYLTEDKTMKLLTQEAFQRSQKDIRIAHILVLLDKKTNDTTAAYKKINEAFVKLKEGSDFGAVAKMYSEDPSVNDNNGDLGYITAFTLPYNLETLAYTTPNGKYSAIYKSNFGYHIFKNNGDRKALGRMQAAQILLQIQPNSTEQQKATIKKLADSIYTNLAKGEVFDNYARTYSNDMYSASAGGLLQEFAVGKYDAVFENTFAQLKDGEVSKPFLTAYGWHIIKRIGSTVPNTTLDASTEQEVLSKVNADSRRLKAEEVFLSTVNKTIGFKELIVNKDVIIKDADAKLKDPTAKIESKEADAMYTIGTKKITIGNFLQFIKDAKSTAAYQNSTTEDLFANYKKVVALEEYRKNLEKYNADYKAQVKEFRDGNLLFEIMERNVWNKSANDEAGLKKYYAANKAKYSWNKSADAIVFSCIDYITTESISVDIKAGKQWKDVLVKYQSNASADSGRFELTNIPAPEQTEFVEKGLTNAFSPNKDNNYVFAYILKLYPAGGQRNFEDAKGLVINDYQIKLEEDWIAALKKKYPINLNETVWKDILAKGK